jgi:hypothetical protein
MTERLNRQRKQITAFFGPRLRRANATFEQQLFFVSQMIRCPAKLPHEPVLGGSEEVFPGGVLAMSYPLRCSMAVWTVLVLPGNGRKRRPDCKMAPSAVTKSADGPLSTGTERTPPGEATGFMASFHDVLGYGGF